MIVFADKKTTDTPAYNMLVKIKTDLPILLLSRVDDLDFDEDVLSLVGREYVVADYIENGWDADYPDTLVVGENTEQFPFIKGDGWQRLHNFMKDNPPKLYLKRELLKKDMTNKLLPIEYPNWQSDYQIQTKEQFDSRPISAFNYWGRSHEARLLLQGEFWGYAARMGYSVCDNIYQFNSFIQKEDNPIKIVTFHIPHYARVDIEELMKINQLSKLSISLPGAGIKCFRSTGESIVNSICVLPEDDLAYSYPLINGVNCIKFSRNNDVTGLKNKWDITGTIEDVLRKEDLYDIYLEGKKVADWYRVDNYIKNYLELIINQA